MKKFYLFLLLTFTLPAFAQYDNVSLGIEKIVKNVPDNDPIVFWKTLKREHPNNKEMRTALNKNKKSILEACGTIPNLGGIRNFVEGKSIKSSQANALIKQIEDVTKIKEAYPDVDFFVVNDNSPNAGMYPEGTCEINTYWLSNSANLEELVAICCHEIGHFIMQHKLHDAWKTVKASKRNQIWAQIGTGIAMGAYAGSQMYASQYGVAQSSEAQQQMYSNIAKAGAQSMYEGLWYAENRQKFAYERDSEVESDIIAFWFMEKNGIDPIYLINLFKRLEVDAPEYTKEQLKTKDHPDFSKRINVLEKLYKKHHKANFISQELKPYPTTKKIGEYLFIDEKGIIHTDNDCSSIKGKVEWCKPNNLSIMGKVCRECVNLDDSDKIYEIAKKNDIRK